MAAGEALVKLWRPSKH